MKILFILLGFIFLGLGVFGVYMPLLPATPFLFIATACFARGSEKFNNWFLSTKLYKQNVEPLKNKTGMEMKTKLRIIATITFFLTISFIVMDNIYGRIAVILVFLFHYYYFFIRVKTIYPKE